MPLGILGKALLSLGGGVGAGVGLGTRGGRKFLFGRGGRAERFPTLAPQQLQFQDQLLQGLQQAGPQALDLLTQLLRGDEEAFSAFEAPLQRRFEREAIPAIAERFGGGAGSHGALSSGALNQALAAAARDLTTDIGALRGGLQQQALGQLQGFSGIGLQPRFQTAYRPPTGGLFGGLAPGLGQGIGQLGGQAGLSALGFLG